MDVEFEDETFGRVCNEFRLLQKAHGKARAKLIGRRLLALNEAKCLADLRHAPGHLHELTADQAGLLTVDLDGPYRLAFRPTQNPPPSKADGGLDWAAVDAVTITGIIDTHR